jgi:predicted aspartyl protease
MRDFATLGALLAAFLLPSAAWAGAACEPTRLLVTMQTLPEADGVPIVPVSMSGKRGLMVVDTGAFWSTIAQGVVRELNLTQMESRITAYSAAGQSSGKYVRVPEFIFGRVLSRDQLFMVSASGNPAETIGENDLAGVIGADLLTRHDADFDFAARTFSLYHQDHCPGQVLHWQPQSHAVVPFRLVDELSITFNVTINGRRATARLDTGSSDTAIFDRAARRTFGFRPDGPNVEQVGQFEGARNGGIYKTTVEKIELGSVVIQNPVVQVIPDLVTRASQRSQVGSLIPVSDVQLQEVMLGASSLKNLHIYIAYKERKLYISQSAAAGDEPSNVQIPAAP